MIEARIVRDLLIGGPPGAAPAHLSAASGLVSVARHVFVVADDENDLARFEPSGGEPGRTFALFEGELPRAHKARKAAKADCEALLLLPPFGA